MTYETLGIPEMDIYTRGWRMKLKECENQSCDWGPLRWRSYG